MMDQNDADIINAKLKSISDDDENLLVSDFFQSNTLQCILFTAYGVKRMHCNGFSVRPSVRPFVTFVRPSVRHTFEVSVDLQTNRWGNSR